MEKIRLGKTDLMVTKLGFGGIPIQRVSEDEAIAVVQRCLDSGITFIDTAHGYTTSEERIGKAITGRRGEIIIATNPSMEGDATAMYIQQQLEPFGVRITRLARGLPIGGDLEYADQNTLMRALDGRQDME